MPHSPAPDVAAAPTDIAVIGHYHAHVYYDPASSRDRAAHLRERVAATFPQATLGRWHDELVGPHLQSMYQIAFPCALLAAFVAIELRSAKPLVPFSIFRIRTLTGANVVGLLVGASLFSMFFFISLYMQQVLGYSAIHAGLSYLPLALVIIASAGVASQLVTKLGYKPVLAAGLVFIVIGLVWFSRVSVGGGFTTDILGPSLFAAAGLGFAFVTTTIAAVSGVEEHEAGLASGLINTSQQIGGALGLAVLSTVATSRIDDSMSVQSLTDGFQAAFLGGAGFALVGFVLTLVLIRGSDSRAHVELGKQEATEGASA